MVSHFAYSVAPHPTVYITTGTVSTHGYSHPSAFSQITTVKIIVMFKVKNSQIVFSESFIQMWSRSAT